MFVYSLEYTALSPMGRPNGKWVLPKQYPKKNLTVLRKSNTQKVLSYTNCLAIHIDRTGDDKNLV